MSAYWQAVIDGTWPPERVVKRDGWTLRIAPGAGGRVNAISGGTDLDAAEALLTDHNHPANFVIWPGDEDLDAKLDARGLVICDAVHLYEIDAATLAGDPLPHATAMPVWPPLSIMRHLWEAGGIGAARQAVMARAECGTGLLGRVDDRAAGVGFVSLSGKTAMIHALDVVPAHRRKGVAHHIMRAAAHWTLDQGGDTLSLVVTRDNPANRLYEALEMKKATGYHYRRPPS
jgi:GNAT superfamily N-acetyltransferase